MRICSIITNFTAGGAETLVNNLSIGFARSGHQATVLALSDAATLDNAVDTEHAMMDRISRAGCCAMSLGLKNRRNVLIGSIALKRRLAEIKPEIIHAHTAQAALMLALLRPDVPILLTHHNSVFKFPTPLFKLFDRFVWGYVGISDACTQLLRSHVRKPVTTIHNAAAARFQALRARSMPGRNPTILSVSRLSDQKDFHTLIRAGPALLGLLDNQVDRPRIRIAGGGTRLAELRALALSEGGGVVELLGERRDVPDLMKTADLYVNSSLYEGMPLAVIEAMMSGLPIVATNVAGNNELVSDGVNGILVPKQEPEAIAQALAHLLTDRARYAAMSHAALDTSRRYSLETAVDQHLQLYAAARQSRSSSRRGVRP